MTNHDSILFLGTANDRPYLPRLKSCVGSAKVFISCDPITTLYEVSAYCKKRNITGVITTSSTLLSKLLPSSGLDKKQSPSVDNFAGSLFTRDNIEYVIVHPLDHTQTVPYGLFLLKRYISKLVYKDKWPTAPLFNWTILTPTNIEHEYELASQSELCAVDIETYKENLAIRCVGFTTLTMDSGKYISRSLVLPLDSDFALAWCSRFLAIKAQKIMQNGKYDCSYLLRYGLHCTNYLWDTATLMHSWYS